MSLVPPSLLNRTDARPETHRPRQPTIRNEHARPVLAARHQRSPPMRRAGLRLRHLPPRARSPRGHRRRARGARAREHALALAVRGAHTGAQPLGPGRAPRVPVGERPPRARGGARAARRPREPVRRAVGRGERVCEPEARAERVGAGVARAAPVVDTESARV